ncbi:hypothetical protein DSECCO2_640920 [anaerobic digester metagenome]
MPGNDFVTCGDKDHAVKLVGSDHQLDSVLYNLPAWERIFHTLVPHCNPVADPYGVELERNSPGIPDSCLYSFSKFVQMNVTRNYIVPGIDNRYERPFHFRVRDPCCLQKGTVCGTFGPLFDNGTSHNESPVSLSLLS